MSSLPISSSIASSSSHLSSSLESKVCVVCNKSVAFHLQADCPGRHLYCLHCLVTLPVTDVFMIECTECFEMPYFASVWLRTGSGNILERIEVETLGVLCTEFLKMNIFQQQVDLLRNECTAITKVYFNTMPNGERIQAEGTEMPKRDLEQIALDGSGSIINLPCRD